MENKAIGEQIIDGVIEEVIKIQNKYNIRFIDSIIINISDLIKEEYTKDLSKFQVLTASVGVIFTQDYSDRSNDDGNFKPISKAIIFNDENITNLPQTNLREIVSLVGGNFEDYKYLSRCTFHLNKIYKSEEIQYIPGIIKVLN